MHLAYVCEDRGIPVDGTKGSSIHVRSLVTALAGLGCEVTLLSPRLGVADWMFPLGIEGVRLNPEPSGVPEDIGAVLTRVHERRPIDGVYERLSLSAPGSSRWCRSKGIPHGIEVNAPLAREAMTYRHLTNAGEAQQIELEILRAADQLFPVSPTLARWLRGLGCDPSKIDWVPNAVSPEWMSAPPAPDATSPAPAPYHVGFVGSLRPWHGIQHLMNAFERLEPGQFRLTIVGDGPLGDWLRKRVREWTGPGLPIEWTGAVPAAHVPSLIDGMDCCVAPYAGVDSFYFSPIKIFEYGARGKPVVAPNLSALTEQFPDGSLVLYDYDSDAALASAIASLAASPDRGASSGSRLRRHVEERTWSHNARTVLRAFSRLCDVAEFHAR